MKYTTKDDVCFPGLWRCHRCWFYYCHCLLLLPITLIAYLVFYKQSISSYYSPSSFSMTTYLFNQTLADL
jgi:hypothetical protein